MESDKVTGLMAGGDDYLTKPFSNSELTGRVKALIRRYHTYNNSANGIEKDNTQYISIGKIRISTTRNEVCKDNTKVSLTELEYQILLLLMRQPGKLFLASVLYERVWKAPYYHSCNGTILAHIRNLRVKLEEDPGNPQLIKTIWGKGYCFDSE